MLAILKKILRSLGVDTTALYQTVSRKSLLAAIRDQGLVETLADLRAAIPDIRDQYTTSFDETEYVRYWEIKMRALHAWQIKCALDALEHIHGEILIIGDIGDSSGNHAIYLRNSKAAERIDRVISINLDETAIEKVKSKGGDAILSRAEEIQMQGLNVDVFFSFETIEHLTDPVRFLHNLAEKSQTEYLLMTVPYRRESRFGGEHMRLPEGVLPDKMTPEEVHIYEFSPEDWLLLARFAGYRPVFHRTYRQYPRSGIWRLTAPLWRKLDFEGFFGVLLKRDPSLSNRYTGW